MPQDSRFIPDDPRFIPDEVEVKGGLSNYTPQSTQLEDKSYTGLFSGSHPLIEFFPKKRENETQPHEMSLFRRHEGLLDPFNKITENIPIIGEFNKRMNESVLGLISDPFAAATGLSGSLSRMLKPRLPEVPGPNIKPNINVPVPHDPNFNAGIGDPELAGSVPYPHALNESNLPTVISKDTSNAPRLAGFQNHKNGIIQLQFDRAGQPVTVEDVKAMFPNANISVTKFKENILSPHIQKFRIDVFDKNGNMSSVAADELEAQIGGSFNEWDIARNNLLDSKNKNKLNIPVEEPPTINPTQTAQIPKAAAPPLPQAATKLLDAMKESVPLTKEQAKIYTKERGEKIGKVRDVVTEGEAGYHERLGALKGEHTKVEIEPLRNKLEQSDVDELFSHIQRAPISDEFAKINASSGLSKLLSGQVPQPSELKVLNKIFGEEFTGQVSNMLPKIDRKQTLISELVNLPRAIMSSIDFSAPLRQGLPLISRKEWWTSFDDMFKAWGSEKAFRGIQESIEAKPNFEFSQTSGLKLTDLTNLSNREEALMSSWAEKIPGVRRSNRAYVAFLNKLRSDTFDALINNAKQMGLDPENNLHLSREIANFVNTATGRGSLGRLEQSAATLNNVFFSPRLIASRVKMLNPATYINASPFVRRQYIKGLLSVAAAGSVASGLAKLAGAEVELDPRSSDFGKAKFGNVRLDPYGGFQQYIVAASRLISGESKSPVNDRITDLTAGKFGRPTRVDILGRFAESKLNPAVGLAMALLRGKEVTGEPFTWPSMDSPVKNSIAQRFLPMFVQDVNDIAQEDPTLMPLVVPAMFGAGTQVFGN